MEALNLLIFAALVATIAVMVLGVRSMGKGGSYDKEHAERFMWERVALQALTVVLLLAAAFLMNT